MHLEAEEKKRPQAEKERVQAENRAKRAGSRAPQSSQLPNSTLTEGGGTDPNIAENDGKPIDQDEPGAVNGDDGNDELSEAGGDEIDFKSALKKKISFKLDGAWVPSLEKNIRIKVCGCPRPGRFWPLAAFGACVGSRRVPTGLQLSALILVAVIGADAALSVLLPDSLGQWYNLTFPSAGDSEPQPGVSIMDELNHAVEFGTVEEARAAPAKIDKVLRRTVQFNPPAGAVASSEPRAGPKTPSRAARRLVVESAPAVSGSKRKSLKDGGDPSSPSDPSEDDESVLVEAPKKRSKTKKKKSKKSKDDSSSEGSSSPSESSSSDDSSAISAAELECKAVDFTGKSRALCTLYTVTVCSCLYSAVHSTPLTRVRLRSDLRCTTTAASVRRPKQAEPSDVSTKSNNISISAETIPNGRFHQALVVLIPLSIICRAQVCFHLVPTHLEGPNDSRRMLQA
ncbi:uncharacterized protein MELLADRAFT_110351 [Melampsora larici-populina 98AG31]|uniref:Uncharacterized protein n=1 Tax=Melampsora larici-populina (strain 98AG31 / pathotype 3-4-7) TaxID=747676 RepID=F4RZH3_MELLP|nr:uncharacterized protein MELLADRAFT_110351 [Melampsora larici-populina 98AG31]EGG02226.1 hypothetical protein MELLADRAFT_110351 [Melampsora larici-populina 98AG31]